jgi:hydroxyethylthiazole kinase-like uncharacterized protein yjeF
MKGYSSEQVRAAEAPQLAAGVPLMQGAARALADECRQLCAGARADGARADAPIVVLVGGGNNGGDALFAAAELARSGARVELVRTSSRVHEEGLAAALTAGAAALEGTPAELADRVVAAQLVIDGILGIGAGPEPALRGRAREVVAGIVARLGRPPAHDLRADPARGPRPLIVAVDIPSGIDPDTGAVPDPAAVLPADVTVTFGGAKAGLLLPPGRDYAGRIRLHDIGLAAELARVRPLVELPD